MKRRSRIDDHSRAKINSHTSEEPVESEVRITDVYALPMMWR